MSVSFQSAINLNFQNAHVTRELLYHVADSDRRLHVKLCSISDKMYQLVFDRRKRCFMSTTSQQTMLVHFLKQSAIPGCTDVVSKNINVVDEVDDCDLARRLPNGSVFHESVHSFDSLIASMLGMISLEHSMIRQFAF
jgi:hypothetical protein